MVRETLKGGAIRLTGKRAAFVYQRLRPGVLITAAKGRDTGEFGGAPLYVIDAERERFQRPVLWYFDASRVEDAAHAVFEQWTEWLRDHARKLARMHVLTATDSARLTIGIARHLSDSVNRVILHADRAGWTEAVLHANAGLPPAPDPAARFEENAVPVRISRESRGGTRIAAPGCAFRFEKIGGGALLCRFEGTDTGDVTDLALDQMEQWLAASRDPARWFLDLREAQTVSPEVSRVWTEWIGVRRERFASISALSYDPLFPLVLTIAKFRSGTERLFRVHRELEPFRAELAASSQAAAAAL